MLVGVCTTLGKDKDRVMVIFGISPQNLMDTLVVTENEGVACYLFGRDKDTALLCCGKNPQNHLESVLHGEAYRDNGYVKHKVLYSSKSNATELTVATYVTEASVQSQLFEQVRVGRRVLLFGMGAVAVLSMFAIWLAYKSRKRKHSKQNRNNHRFPLFRDRLGGWYRYDFCCLYAGRLQGRGGKGTDRLVE